MISEKINQVFKNVLPIWAKRYPFDVTAQLERDNPEFFSEKERLNMGKYMTENLLQFSNSEEDAATLKTALEVISEIEGE